MRKIFLSGHWLQEKFARVNFELPNDTHDCHKLIVLVSPQNMKLSNLTPITIFVDLGFFRHFEAVTDIRT